MKMHCYFLLNIKHGASQFYWGRPPNTTEAPEGGGGGACLGASLGPRERGLSEAPGGGLQLSSAGTVPVLDPAHVYSVLNRRKFPASESSGCSDLEMSLSPVERCILSFKYVVFWSLPQRCWSPCWLWPTRVWDVWVLEKNFMMTI